MDKMLSLLTIAVLVAVGFVAGQKYQRQSEPQRPADAIFGPQPAPVTAHHAHTAGAEPVSQPPAPLSPPYRKPKPVPSPRHATDEELARTTYRGFYRNRDGKYRRIQFHNGEDTQFLSVETEPNKYQTWRSEMGDLDMGQRNGSFVLTMPGPRSAELRFQRAQPIHGLEGEYRSMVGSMTDPQGALMSIAMVEAFTAELESIKDKNEYIWPALGALQSMLENYEAEKKFIQ